MVAGILAALAAGRLCASPTITRLRDQLAQATSTARVDPLTGLLNRTGIVERYTAALQAGEYVELVLIDLDRFKNVNDSHGHEVGDRLALAVRARHRDAV